MQYRVRGTPVPTTQTRGTNYPKSTVKIIHVSDQRLRPFRTAKQFELTERDRLLLTVWLRLKLWRATTLPGCGEFTIRELVSVFDCSGTKGSLTIKAFSRASPAFSPSPAKAAGTVDGRTLLIKEMLSGISSLLALARVEPWHTRFWLWILLYLGRFMGTRS